MGPSLRLGSPLPQGQGQTGQGALRRRKSAESRSGHATPRERGLPGAGLRGRERARGCRVRGRAGRPRVRGCGSAPGAAGARGSPGYPRTAARPPASSVTRRFGAGVLRVPVPDVTAARRPGRPFRGPFGEWGEGSPAVRPRMSAPATLLVPLFPQVPSCVSSRVLSAFICFPRYSPFQCPICSPFSVSVHPPAFRPLSSFPCTPRTFSEVGGEGRCGKVPVGVGRPLAAHLSRPGLRPGRGPATRHPSAPTRYPPRSGVQVLG